jgi:hypothetical protein
MLMLEVLFPVGAGPTGEGILYLQVGFGSLATGSGSANFTTIANNGAGYTTGTYNNVPLYSEAGVSSGVMATIVALGGVITSYTITSGGFNNCPPTSSNGYSDYLGITTASAGGTGGGALIQTNYPSLTTGGGGNSVSSATLIFIDTYGTGGTSGVGAAGTYQTTGSNVAITTATNTTATAGMSLGVICSWTAWFEGLLPLYSLQPPRNIMEPVPELNILQTLNSVAANLEPPLPLPGSTTGGVSSYAI